MERSGFIVLVVALVGVLAFSVMGAQPIEAQVTERETNFQFNCQSSGCIYDFDYAWFEPGTRVSWKNDFYYPGEAVRSHFWPTVHDFVGHVVARVRRPFELPYLHLVWNP